jgi:hypothetical protein
MQILGGNMSMASAVAIVTASAARAMIMALGMAAENAQRKHRGESMAYTEDDFLLIIEREGIGSNAVLNYLNQVFS